MTEPEPIRKLAKPKAAVSKAASKGASKAAPKPAPEPSGAAPKAVTPAAAEPSAPAATGAQPDETPIPPRNRHERRSAGKKRPGQAPFRWPPIGPERP